MKLTAAQVKKLRRILAWIIHQRHLDPMTTQDAQEIYDALSNPSHKAAE